MSNPEMKFPKDFLWGAASSAYQIEGAHDEGGKGESIWDRFPHTPGKVANGDTGEVACDHYHRFGEDIDLMTGLNLQAYRFSVSWPRILPEGRGRINPKGLDFYSRLVDGLLSAGIEPFLTLYCWDLPQALQEEGGWVNRETVDCFAEYASDIFDALGDRVRFWITHNEPWVVAFGGHFLGILAPGIRDLALALQVAHHLLLAHGMAVRILREIGGENLRLGIDLNLCPVHPASQSPADRAAAIRIDGYMNRWFLDPLFKGAYPQDLMALFGRNAPKIMPGDMKYISSPVNFLGLNYYTRVVMQAANEEAFLGARGVVAEGSEYTDNGWEIYPQGLYEILVRLKKEYAPAAIYVTENGASFADKVDETGAIDDQRRLQFLEDHFAQALRAIEESVPLRGYFVWSLMDVFEWDSGYSKRFGLVRVDRLTLERTVKRSGHWYAQFIQRQKNLVS
jgi:beta-glucosidase